MKMLRFLLACALLCTTSPVMAQEKVPIETLDFPAGQATVDVPTQFYFPRLYVRVTIGGRGMDFILDSGAGGILIDAQILKQLGIQTTGTQTEVAARSFTAGLAIVPEMRIGDIVMHNVPVHATTFASEETSQVQRAGLLGYDFLGRVGLTIDYRSGRVTAMRPDQYDPPAPTTVSQVLPIRLDTRVPTVAMKINGVTAENMVVDTGAATDLMLFDHFTKSHPEVLATNVALRLRTMANWKGVGGSFDATGYSLKSVDLGMFHLTNFAALAVTSVGSYPYNADGVVGPGILGHFTVGFDYGGGKMYLVHQSGQ